MIPYICLAIVICVCITYLWSLSIKQECKHKYVAEATTSIERRKEGSLGSGEKRYYSVECFISRCEHCGNLKKTFVD